MKVDLKKLTEDIKAAKEAARAAIEGMSDQGTCNLDTLILDVGGGAEAVLKRKSNKLQGAIERAGVRCEYTDSKWHRGYFIWLGVGEGQGATRTAAARAASEVLNNRGWPSHVWYQMD